MCVCVWVRGATFRQNLLHARVRFCVTGGGPTLGLGRRERERDVANRQCGVNPECCGRLSAFAGWRCLIGVLPWVGAPLGFVAGRPARARLRTGLPPSGPWSGSALLSVPSRVLPALGARSSSRAPSRFAAALSLLPLSVPVVPSASSVVFALCRWVSIWGHWRRLCV